MITIKDKEVRAIENNLCEARKELKELKEERHTLALENEKLKVESISYEKVIKKLNKKVEKLESKLNDDIWRR